jgi:tRNA(fMet)-specific endonuclease VapC
MLLKKRLIAFDKNASNFIATGKNETERACAVPDHVELADNSYLPRSQRLNQALKELVTVNVSSEELIEAYVKVEAACFSAPKGAQNMGKNDIWIAATALVTGLPIITTDKDFDHLNQQLITVYWVDPGVGKS